MHKRDFMDACTDALQTHSHMHVDTHTHAHTCLYLTHEAVEKVVDKSTVPNVLITVSQPLHPSEKNMLSLKVS